MRVARAAFFAYVALLIVMWIAGLPLQMAALQTPCLTERCPSVHLRADDFAQLVASGASPAFYAVYMTVIVFLLDTLSGAIMAILLVTRRPNDWVALLLAIPMVSHSFNFMSHPDLLQQFYPWLWPVTLLPVLGITIFWMPAFSLLPDGKWVPRWSRWLIPYVIVLGANAYFGHLFLPEEVWRDIGAQTFFANFVILTGFQVWRYVRATPSERLRVRWVVLGILLSFLVVILANLMQTLIPELARIGSPLWFVFYPLTISSPILMYLCIWIAVLRYRLFDLDIIIRRTLIYSVLTALLVLFYFGSVVVLQQLLRGITGQGSDVAIIISTLAIAALFNPLRHRVQDVIDHRFFRRKYNAQKVLAAFGATARDEVELNKLTSELVGVVQDTMQPASVSLWLKTGARERG